MIDRMREGESDQGDEIRTILAKEAVQRGIVELAEGETDEPVTADTKRLIRLPGSLHGKTGLLVRPIPLDGLKAFDPLVDTVALPWEETDVVVAAKRASFTLRGESLSLPENDPVELPRAAAFFAVARRLAVPAEERDGDG
jgi:DNA primase small subunit